MTTTCPSCGNQVTVTTLPPTTGTLVAAAFDCEQPHEETGGQPLRLNLLVSQDGKCEVGRE